jgi:hypothetical protein
MSRPGTLSLPHHTNTLFPLLALGVGPPHLSQGTYAEIDVLRGADAVIRQEQRSKENAIADLEGIILEEGSAEMLFDESANCANQEVTFGLSDGVQPLNDSALVETWSFERTVGDETGLIESLLEGFPNNVVALEHEDLPR